jgi:hypothetical protein
MPANNLQKAAILALLLVVSVIGGWEIYLRSRGVAIYYDNGKELWADQRSKVYEPADKATVFIGSSRIKFDLDIDTWQTITGKQAVQLAIEGSSPVPILKDLASDTSFRGRLVVDVMEPLFFSNDHFALEKPTEYLAWYKKRTPAQKASFVLNHVLESWFVFLDKDKYSLTAGLDALGIPNRPGVYQFPAFPDDFNNCLFNRQSKMTPRFVADTALQRRVQNVWVFVMETGRKAPPPKEDPVPPMLAAVKNAVDRIRSRGGDVVFVRPPSTGAMGAMEQHVFNRQKFWDPLVAATGSKGIFFTDYPATSHFICPEWSHLTPQDAISYTKALINELPPSFTH